MTIESPMHDVDVLADVAQRMLALHESGTTTLEPAVMERPVSTYLDPARWDRELDLLFRRAPVVGALSAQLASPGDQLPVDLAGTPVVLVRGSDGVARAFLNVCRHRGAPVVEAADCGRRMSCRYHGWSYDLEGTLVGVPGAAGFDDMDRANRGLAEITCVERSGVIWLVVDGGSPAAVDAYVGSFANELETLGLADVHHVETRRIDAACNWHLAMDTNTESYHFPFLHRSSIAPFTMGNLNVVDYFGPAQRLGFGASSLPDLADEPIEQWDLPMLEAHLQFVYLIHPNISLLVLGDHVELFQIFPGATVDTSVLLQSYFVRSPMLTDTDRMIASSTFDLFHGVVRDEDFPMAEAIQRGLRSGANSALTFGRNEPALQYLHRQYDAALA